MIIDSDMQGGIAHAGPPRLQRATWFDGVNDHVILSDVLSALSSYTLAYRAALVPVNSAKGVSWRIPYLGTGSTIPGMELSVDVTGKLFGGTRAGYRLTTTYQVALEWNVFGLTYVKATGAMSIYRNGAALTSGAVVIPDATGYPVCIGWSPYQPAIYAQGIIMDVVVMGRALSPAEMVDPYSVTETRLLDAAGHGTADADWGGTVYGSPEPAYIRGDGKIIVAGEIKNP